MTKKPLQNEIAPQEKKSSKYPRWLLVVIPVFLIGVCCIVSAVIVVPLVFKFDVDSGGYSIESVTLSSDLKDNQPIDVKDVFMPHEPIVCTVKTSGVDGIIGMRWYFGDNLIYEHTNKTKNNTISTYIQSSKSSILSEGKYRVEIYIVEDPLETVNLEVKIYHPTVDPPISIPSGHKNIEAPWYPEIPFVFDEVWKIDNAEWNVNEVKVILIDDTQEYFVTIVIDTDMSDIVSLSESAAKEIARPIALFALKNGYIEQAKQLELDGKYYDLDQYIFVTLLNPSNQQVYRVKFAMDELK